MSLYLCKDEKILKNWTFASDDTSAGKKNYNFTVTDKRIISTTSAEHFIERTELPLASVKRITGRYSANKQEQANPKTIMIFFGILLVIIGVLLAAMLNAEIIAVVLGILIAVGGLILAAYGGSRSAIVTTYAGFELNITTYGHDSSSMTVGKQYVSADAQAQTISITHITINETAAREIIDMLGALVIGKEQLKSSRVTDDGLNDEVAATQIDEPVLSKEN